MKFRVTYTIPFSPDPELREKVFQEEVSCGDSQTVRKRIYKKHHNANIVSIECISFPN
jgi:hypothetical protein